ncbi:hypothetical protein BHE74_00036077 [Ensete ventricosum]|nr:hypothetical protein GW17_00016667 [Ensete ventricosum]RWW57180.1 hypothetical protein BHE74_00036077 [Ensete ventricosum]RZS17401.1 hypothetical protein BHM03_00049546 [Ensete ventricosum]
MRLSCSKANLMILAKKIPHQQTEISHYSWSTKSQIHQNKTIVWKPRLDMATTLMYLHFKQHDSSGSNGTSDSYEEHRIPSLEFSLGRSDWYDKKPLC